MSKISEILKSPGTYAILVIAILLGAAAYECYRAYNIEETHAETNREWLERYAIYREQLNDWDTITNWDNKTVVSALKTVRQNQIAIIDRQNDLIADLRQETNNNIDKMNLWLAFAAIILSTVGVFIPAWAQYIKDKNFKEDLTQFKNHITEQTTHSLGAEINKSKEENAKCRETLNKITQNATLQEMRSQFVSLSMGYETRLLNNHSDRERLFSFLWTRTVDAFNKVIELSFKDETDKEDSRTYITECLVLLCSFISKIKSSTVRIKPRKWDSLQDEIRTLLKEVSDGQTNHLSWQLYHEHFKAFLTKLNTVHLPE